MGVRWQREVKAQGTARQPGLNSHLNASEVALTAITADGRLLTHASASPGRRAYYQFSCTPSSSQSQPYTPPISTPLRPGRKLPSSRDNDRVCRDLRRFQTRFQI